MDRLLIEQLKRLQHDAFIEPCVRDKILNQLLDTMRLSHELLNCLNRQQRGGTGGFTGEVHMAINRLNDYLNPYKESDNA